MVHRNAVLIPVKVYISLVHHKISDGSKSSSLLESSATWIYFVLLNNIFTYLKFILSVKKM